MTQPTVAGHIILEQIGVGGMGEVFLAEDLKLQRKVALKFLSQARLEDKKDRTRFLREARSAASLNHPNICTVYQVGEVESDTQVDGDPPRVIPAGTPFLAMELIEGDTLDQILARSGTLPVESLSDIARQVAEGLAEAHQHGIVHRDLKPQNIMRTRQGRIKILDFGLAKSIAPLNWGDETRAIPDSTAPALTGQGSVVGTPAYMSPEQATGRKVSFSSDIFSFGLILSEMATGRLAFDAPTAMSILAKIIEAEPEPLNRPDLPPALVAIRDRCLRKPPPERYQDGRELCAALRAAALSPTEAPDSATRALAAAPASLSPRPRGGRRWIGLLAAVILLGAIVGVGLRFLGRGAPAEGPTLAVLPFRNLGPADREYVAQGLTEEVTRRLSSLRGLEVVSSASALRYKGSEGDPREISRELGAQYLLTGSLTWSRGGSVQITCSLVRGDKGTNFWTERFDAPADTIFTLQADIAERVARELDVRLLEPVRQALSVRPTQNADAYDFYLRGYDAESRNYDEESARLAAEMYKASVAADPGFALAQARLSMAESWMYWAGFDLSDSRVSGARTAAERALAIEPDLPEANLAIGYYYYRCERDYDEALARFESVRESLPNDSALFLALGAVHRRRGNLQAARQEFERAFRLDPRSHVKAWEAGETLRFMREFREADRYYGLALELDPEFVWAFVSRGELRLLGDGDPAEAEKVLAAAPSGGGAGTELAWLRVACPVFQEDYVQALEVLATQQFDHPAPPLIFRLWIHELIEDREGARTVADTLQMVMRSVVAGEPEEPNAHSILGLSLAVLGETEEAIREGNRAVELAGDDALREAEMRFQLAWIHWTLGNREATYTELRGLLSEPSWLTRARLRVDPTFRDARGDPGFEELLEDRTTTGDI